MNTTRAGLFLVSLVLASPAHAAAGYDKTWYRAEFWSGEYPDGFGVVEETTVKVRSEPSPRMKATLDCVLPKNATYHPWNADRVAADKLAFVSYSKIDDMRVNKPISVTLYKSADQSQVPIRFKRGDRWKYLTYLAEGAFLMEVDGTIYEGDQELFEASTPRNADDDAVHEWLQLTCANGATGWLFLPDVTGLPTISQANIVTYGEARDIGK